MVRMNKEAVKSSVETDGEKGSFWRIPLDSEVWKRSQGKVVVIPERCKGCKFCIQFCPLNVLKESTAINSKGYHYPEVVKPEECTGCALCEHICPEFAIISKKEGEVPVCVKF